MKIALLGDAIGQLNNCIAIAQQLVRREVEVVFIVSTEYAEFVRSNGFDVVAYDMGDDCSSCYEQVNETISAWNKPPQEQIQDYIAPYYKLIVDSTIATHASLEQVVERVKADIYIVDDVVTYPAIYNSGSPWIRLISCDETELADSDIPPHLSGMSLSEKDNWWVFAKNLERFIKPYHVRYNEFLASQGVPELHARCFAHISPYMNLLLCPKQIAYERKQSADSSKLTYLNGCIRDIGNFELPEFDAEYQNFPLIYFSFGTMGTADIEFTRILLSAFLNQNFRVIATVGEQYTDKYSGLPNNVAILGYASQPAIIKQSDLVIFHGGNNTNTECYYFGKPVIVIPFAWDGFANAVRREDLSLGIYLKRHQFEPACLPIYSQKLLFHKRYQPMRMRLLNISKEMQQEPGPEQVVSVVETLYHDIVEDRNKTTLITESKGPQVAVLS